MMRLGDDTRGRIPFALVGVLLLLGSTTYAATVSTRGPDVDRSVEATTDRATAAAATAMRTAVRRAARDAARTPVTTPADTAVGDVLNRSSPFRDALRVRIYVAVREELRRTEHRRNGVTAVASLEPTPNVSALRAAKRRVRLDGRDNGTAMDVTVRGVVVTARRNGRVVARRIVSPSLTVRTPVLALHDRTETFQRRLNRSALAGPGLERRLTARLYPLVWARGYAQFGGLPLQNVLANRHVSVATNGALIDVQRGVYGRSDPAARYGYDRAAIRMGVSDLAAPYSTDSASFATDLLPGPTDPMSPPATIRDAVSTDANASSGRRFTVRVGRSADRAFVAFLDGESGPSLDAVRRNAYRVDARALTSVGPEYGDDPPDPVAPGPGWTLRDERVHTGARIVSTVAAPTPSTPRDAAQLARAGRRVRLVHTAVRTWARAGKTTTTRAQWSTTRTVGVVLVARYRPPGVAPDRPTSPLFEAGGALDGPNLKGVPDRAEEALDAAGGVNRAARLAALGEAPPNETLYGERPASLSRWVARDVIDLRNRVRNVSVTVGADDVAAARGNAPARLAARIRERRSALLDAPTRYDGVADRARVEARAAYLDALLAELDRRAARTSATNDAVTAAFRRAGISADRAVRVHRTSVGGRDATGNASAGPAFTPDGAPGYLTLDAVAGERFRTVPDRYGYQPLVARNVNVFTVPYADATDHALDAVLPDGDSVPLGVAGRTLVAANRTLEATNGTGGLRTRRDALLAEVEASNRFVERHAVRVVGEATDLRRPEREAAVRAAAASWNGSGRLAMAASNGSLAPAVAAAVRERTTLNATRYEVLATRLRVGIAAATARATVPKAPANRTSVATRRLVRGAVRRVATEAAGNATETLGKTRLSGVYGTVLAGMPVAPLPGYWYATVNAWTVTVRGTYPSFAVHTRRGGETPLTYVRDGSVARLDVDDDGVAERLGRSDRISFDVRTVILVAVPTAGRGVGDVDGNADERSPGWPTPGCDLPNERPCPRGRSRTPASGGSSRRRARSGTRT